MLTALIIIFCLLLFQCTIYLLQAFVFAYRGFIGQSEHYKNRFWQKLLGMGLLIILLLLCNEFSKYLN